METIVDLLTGDKEKAGRVSFRLTDSRVFDKEVKDVTIFYKLVGDSRFKLFRSNGFELVFVHLTEDWMRQARVDLEGFDYTGGIDVELAWDEKEDTMSVKGAEEENFVTVTAMQIDS